MTSRKLTDGQEKAVQQVETYLRDASSETKKMLSDAGLDPGEPHFECLLCDCDGFDRSPRPPFACKEPGCGHHFFQHNIPT